MTKSFFHGGSKDFVYFFSSKNLRETIHFDNLMFQVVGPTTSEKKPTESRKNATKLTKENMVAVSSFGRP